MHNFTNVYVTYEQGAENAAKILCEEIEKRIGKKHDAQRALNIHLELGGEGTENFKIEISGDRLNITGASELALIYGIGLFLRKTVYESGCVDFVCDISGEYKPDKKIRGHQLGYRACSNTYDAWKENDYRKYMLDMMFFGANMAEFIPEDDGNDMMDSCETMLRSCVTQAKKLGLKVSLWYPNDELSAQESAAHRRLVLSKVPETDVVFIPGSDPGDYSPRELFKRVKLIANEIKNVCNAEIWVSAQAPHDSPEWGDDFITELEKLPDEITGVIMGPNHAMPLDELRKRTPEKYPIRFYPDITHNVRCEYPVHYKRDDWHFSLAVVNGRESINPRPTEYAVLHAETSPYIIGSCSYSEGVNDDINKMLWSALDFCPDLSVNEILEDYSRLFFPGIDASAMANAILMLEQNWDRDSAENPGIEKTLSLFEEFENDYPFLCENWRFNSLLFRAECDALSRRRRIFEHELIKKSCALTRTGVLNAAYDLLCTDFDKKYKALHKDIDRLAKLLFSQIGLQLDIGRYHASGWERGATLESIDLPITDRLWLKNQLEAAIDMGNLQAAKYALSAFKRNEIGYDEKYVSVALDGIQGFAAEQKTEVYLNFKGDNPNENNGNLPVCMLTAFDSFTLNAEFDGLYDCDYILKITYSDKPERRVNHHRVEVNGTVLYDGKEYGGHRTDSPFLPSGFVMKSYDIPREVIESSHASIEISEPTVGFEIYEMWLVKA